MEATVEEVEATRGVMKATVEEVEATGGVMKATVDEVEATGGVLELIHNLPNKFETFPINSILKINSIIYINSNNFNKKYQTNYISTLNYSNINSNNIK